MKKYILFILAICIISLNPVSAQLGGILKKATKSVSNEVLGKSDSPKNVNSEPEPGCASDQAELKFDLGGNLNLVYAEIGIMMKDDGSLLLKDKVGGNYYIANNGVTQGPYKEGDPKIAGFDPPKDDNQGEEDLQTKYKQYISKSGDKYLITFNGKSYGTYATISNFIVSKAKTKFAALATKNVMLTEDEGKKMEAAIKNAKTQQEQAEIAQKYAQKMQENMMAGGSNETTGPELVTNIPDSHYDIMESGGENLLQISNMTTS